MAESGIRPSVHQERINGTSGTEPTVHQEQNHGTSGTDASGIYLISLG
jgi:hypothetical protein